MEINSLERISLHGVITEDEKRQFMKELSRDAIARVLENRKFTPMNSEIWAKSTVNVSPNCCNLVVYWSVWKCKSKQLLSSQNSYFLDPFLRGYENFQTGLGGLRNLLDPLGVWKEEFRPTDKRKSSIPLTKWLTTYGGSFLLRLQVFSKEKICTICKKSS